MQNTSSFLDEIFTSRLSSYFQCHYRRALALNGLGRIEEAFVAICVSICLDRRSENITGSLRLELARVSDRAFYEVSSVHCNNFIFAFSSSSNAFSCQIVQLIIICSQQWRHIHMASWRDHVDVRDIIVNRRSMMTICHLSAATSSTMRTEAIRGKFLCVWWRWFVTKIINIKLYSFLWPHVQLWWRWYRLPSVSQQEQKSQTHSHSASIVSSI